MSFEVELAKEFLGSLDKKKKQELFVELIESLSEEEKAELLEAIMPVLSREARKMPEKQKKQLKKALE